MQSQYTLTELATEITRRQAAKQDFIADTRKISMTEDAKFAMEDFGTVEANGIAHNQVATRIEVPTKYYDRMLAEAPALLANNVNHWLHATPEPRMIRLLDGRMRAFLSNRYNRIENEEIAQVVLPELATVEGMEIISCAITERRMYIKAVFTKIEGEVAKGDVVQSGVVISNSEVGQGAVSIKPFVYRLVCLNGMIAEDSKYTARHVGGKIDADERIREMLTDETVQADDRAILLKVRDVLRGSFDEARFAERLQVMRAAADGQRLEAPVAAIKLLGKKLGITEGEQNSVLKHLIEGADLTRWGVLNAVTRTAQDADNYDRATELETIGGNILYFPHKQWDEVAMAAAA